MSAPAPVAATHRMTIEEAHSRCANPGAVPNSLERREVSERAQGH
jgi:hypothetical protein